MLKVLFDNEYNPSEKVFMSLIFQQAWENGMKLEDGQFWMDFTNGELGRIIGGASIRSLNRYLTKLKNKGLIRVTISNIPRLNYRRIYLTRKGIKYFFDLDMGESVTVVATNDTMII